MHEQVMEWAARQVAHLPRPARAVLEIGSLDINGSLRPLFGQAAHYHGLDLVAGDGVDEVADAADWVPPRRYDVVVCAEVLEHAPRWRDIVATMAASLDEHGTVLVTCATDPRPPHSAVDGWAVRDGEHYGNVAPAALRDALLGALADGGRGAEPDSWAMEVGLDRGDLYLRADR